MHSPLNGGTCFAEESAIPETPRILFLKFHRNEENPSHSKAIDKFCKPLGPELFMTCMKDDMFGYRDIVN